MSERKKVFIIDDEVDLCMLMRAYFLRKNYEVSIAHTIDEAFFRLRQFFPDLILLDVTVCKNPKEDIREIERLAPNAELIINNGGY